MTSVNNNPTKWGLGFEADSGTLRGAPESNKKEQVLGTCSFIIYLH